MKYRAGVGFAAAILLILSSLAHAFAGWPPLIAALQTAGLDEETIGAIAVG